MQGDTTKDVALGFDSVAGYENTSYYLGATIGRHTLYYHCNIYCSGISFLPIQINVGKLNTISLCPIYFKYPLVDPFTTAMHLIPVIIVVEIIGFTIQADFRFFNLTFLLL